MVNRYITALLVVLAATGMEAQTYQQALRFALTDISYDEFIQQPEAKALEEDILSVIKAIKEASEDHQKAQHHFPSAILFMVRAGIRKNCVQLIIPNTCIILACPMYKRLLLESHEKNPQTQKNRVYPI